MEQNTNSNSAQPEEKGIPADKMHVNFQTQSNDGADVGLPEANDKGEKPQNQSDIAKEEGKNAEKEDL